MKWKKLGLIFCPNGKSSWMKTHAALPFAEAIKGDLLRIYFNSRDAKGRSHVGFLEINLQNPGKILHLSKKPLLSPGGLASFDEDGAMISWKVPRKDGNYIYYSGWNLGVTVPFRNSIGLAIEKGEGKVFRKPFKGPLLDRSIHDPCFIANPCVLVEGQKWKMWYLSCVNWEKFNRKVRHWYHLKYAESRDGINWRREGQVAIEFKNKDEYAISRPSVLKKDGTYKMWYSYRGDRYRIGYAESRDGKSWVRKDRETGIDTSPSGWDSEMVEYPHVFAHDGNLFMLYNGNRFGKSGFGLAVLEEP